jgi:hypothetical protein
MMRTRQLRKAHGRKTGEGFTPIMGQLHKSGMNRLARRGAAAGWGRSPKGGVNWRKKQWVWGMAHHPRLLDRRCFKTTGRYLAELAEAINPVQPSKSVVRKILAKIGL